MNSTSKSMTTFEFERIEQLPLCRTGGRRSDREAGARNGCAARQLRGKLEDHPGLNRSCSHQRTRGNFYFLFTAKICADITICTNLQIKIVMQTTVVVLLQNERLKAELKRCESDLAAARDEAHKLTLEKYQVSLLGKTSFNFLRVLSFLP